MGASALVSTAIGVVFQVTGVNDKINKAASKVFGEDLVKIANIAGAVYGAWNGGFSLDPAKQFMGIGEAASGASSATSLADAAFEADWSAATSGMTGAGTQGLNLSDVAQADKLFESDWASATKGLNLSNGQETFIDTSPRANRVAEVNASANGAPTASPAAPTTAGIEQRTPQVSNANASATNAAGTQATAAQSGVDKLLGINRSTPNATAANAAAGQQSVFDKVLSKVGDKTIAGLIQGAAAGYGNSQQARLAEERARVNPTTIRGYTYRPTV